MKDNFKTIVIIFFSILICLQTSFAFAANRFSLISVRPNPDLGRYFFTQESSTLPQLGWTTGLFTLYYKNLLNMDWEITTLGRRSSLTTSEQYSGLDNLLFQYIYAAIGATDRISFMFDMPVFIYYRSGYATATESRDDYYWLSAGDLRLAGKINILSLEKWPVGLAFMTSVTFPTGKEERFLGEDGFTVEENLIAEVKPLDKLTIALNIGFQTRSKVDVNNISFRDVLKFSLGANYNIINNLSIIAEAEMQTAINNAFGAKNTTPAEIRAGVKWYPDGGNFSLGAGASTGLIYGKGMPKYAGFINFGYSSIKRTKTDSVKKPIKPLIKPETIKETTFTPVPESELTQNIPDQEQEIAEEIKEYQPPPTQKNQEALQQEIPEKELPEQRIFIDENNYSATYKIYFQPSSCYIDYTARFTIDDIIDFILARGNTANIEVRGWADPRGEPPYTKELSLRRAELIANYLKGMIQGKNITLDIKILDMGVDNKVSFDESRRVEVLVKVNLP